MKYIKKIITILIIIIIILVGCIIYMVQYRKNINQVEEGDPGEELELNEDQMKDVTDRNRFFTVKNCVQYYLDEINNHNSNYFSADGSEKIFTEEEIKTAIESILTEKGLEPVKKSQGVVMKEIMAKYKGQTDGKTVNKVLSTILK